MTIHLSQWHIQYIVGIFFYERVPCVQSCDTSDGISIAIAWNFDFERNSIDHIFRFRFDQNAIATPKLLYPTLNDLNCFRVLQASIFDHMQEDIEPPCEPSQHEPEQVHI